MRFGGLGRISRSIFTKLMLVLLLTGVIINILVVAFFHFTFEETQLAPLSEHVILYLRYLIRDMGNPPSLKSAKRICGETNFEIRYESPDLTWSTSEKIPTARQLHAWANEKELYVSGSHSGMQVWRMERHMIRRIFFEKEYFLVTEGESRFIFDMVENYPRQLNTLGILLLAVLTGVIVAAYFAIRILLNPVMVLSNGVRQVSAGNLDYQVSVRRSDELGEMANAFNDMTARIKDMLHAREQLLLDVSHELRSPLTRMKVALEFMPETRVKNNIREDVSEMEKMITEILETARLRNKNARMNWQRINIADMIREILPLFDNHPPGFQINNMSDSLVTDADPELIKTVLKNILGNALKYSGESDSPVSIALTEKESYVIIEVSDKGIGIPQEELTYIFEPFYRVDKSRSKDTGGYGLGLSLCKTIMEAHNGKIEIESCLKKGTTVSLFLPDSQEPHGTDQAHV